MSEELVQYQPSNTAIEAVIAKGDLSKLTPTERVNYYVATCRSLGLNELTQPFGYITLNGKLTLYAKRDAADQLRRLNGVSLSPPTIQFQDDLVIVNVNATDRAARTDSDLGAVSIAGLKGVDRANAIMKAITKAKRRVTLSICGLGWADESEIDSIRDARPVSVDVETGEIMDSVVSRVAAPADDSVAYDHMVPPKRGNGKAKPDRVALEARLGEIVGQLAALGQDVTIDEAWLADASDADLITEGKRLAGLLATAKAAQAALPMDGAA